MSLVEPGKEEEEERSQALQLRAQEVLHVCLKSPKFFMSGYPGSVWDSHETCEKVIEMCSTKFPGHEAGCLLQNRGCILTE